MERLAPRIGGATLESVRVASPFLVRTVDPPLDAAVGARVRELRRIGKRVAIGFDNGVWIVLHLMIAGRLHWKPCDAKLARTSKRGAAGLAAFEFAAGALTLTEAGTKRRASIHAVRGEAALADLDRGGVDPLDAGLEPFRAALLRETHTLKRALTDPSLVSGIGNAYSDEILHRARLSPIAMTTKLSADEIARLHRAVRETLIEWTDRLRAETGDGFPERVTAFREGFAVHGRFGKPCPACGSAVQRIRHADNETNYCAACQTGGKLLADRSLSRLLKSDWPRTLEEMERRRGR